MSHAEIVKNKVVNSILSIGAFLVLVLLVFFTIRISLLPAITQGHASSGSGFCGVYFVQGVGWLTNQTAGNGWYCGQTANPKLGYWGGSNYDYECVNHYTQATNLCGNGPCIINSWGSDFCTYPDNGGYNGDPCYNVHSGNGAYCGGNAHGNGTGGYSNYLYYCQNNRTTAQKSCSNGCYWNPYGQDRCN